VITVFRGDIASAGKPGTGLAEAPPAKPFVLGRAAYLQDLHLEAKMRSQRHQGAKIGQRALRVVDPSAADQPQSTCTDFDRAASAPTGGPARLSALASRSRPADLIILPGSKSVAADLAFFANTVGNRRSAGHLRYGPANLLGVCARVLQMLGQRVDDPLGPGRRCRQPPALGLPGFFYPFCKAEQASDPRQWPFAS